MDMTPTSSICAPTLFSTPSRVTKTNTPHFESVDCGVAYFHVITGVRYTRNAIDSIVINHKEVNYDATQQHFHIYFKEYRF